MFLTQDTFIAVPANWWADGLPETDEQMVDIVPFFLWEPRFKRSSCLFRRFGLMPAPQIGDAVHVNIDADAFISTPRYSCRDMPSLGRLPED